MSGYWVFVLLLASAFATNNNFDPAEKNCSCLLLTGDYEYFAVGKEDRKEVNVTLNITKDTLCKDYCKVVVYENAADQYLIKVTLEQTEEKIILQHQIVTNVVLFYISLSTLIYFTMILLRRMVTGYWQLPTLTLETNLNVARAVPAELVTKQLDNCRDKNDSNILLPDTCNDRRQKQKNEIPICHTRKYLLTLLDEERGEIP